MSKLTQRVTITFVSRDTAHTPDGTVATCPECDAALVWGFDHAMNGHFNAYAFCCGNQYQGVTPDYPYIRQVEWLSSDDSEDENA